MACVPVMNDSCLNRTTQVCTDLPLSNDSPPAVIGNGSEPGTSACLAFIATACYFIVALASSRRLPPPPVLRSELLPSVRLTVRCDGFRNPIPMYSSTSRRSPRRLPHRSSEGCRACSGPSPLLNHFQFEEAMMDRFWWPARVSSSGKLLPRVRSKSPGWTCWPRLLMGVRTGSWTTDSLRPSMLGVSCLFSFASPP